ncbi:Ugd Predicted UDP-glucose 6-dehydrogenase [uncultured Caudovirales phage]|uniref:Ugd Predicted UDP-glucose 6-dehydrogenase n=1 Tax=uncultured Caudovirales phage TaxID=2100421 RepID=A0A6J5MZQ6_9CAUD|nr:Ugd Predicted UDP-glucose 6-dehydrogenase [uncultured Caudovirales phage]
MNKISKDCTVAIVGFGVVGQAYYQMFPDAVVYDEPKDICTARSFPSGIASTPIEGDRLALKANSLELWIQDARTAVNDCDVAIVAVFTPHNEDGSLDTSIVEEVVGWIDCPLIIIKSALHPGTTDMLVKKTGKRIAVSVEYIGEGTYPVHFWKFPHQTDPRMHMMLVVGGEDEVAEQAIEVLWSKLSPDVKIHKVTALEAEIVKLVENSYGALKVTFINTLMSLAKASDTSFIRIHQAWNSDPRTDSMHIRAVSHNRGWKSKCWSKDLPALVAYAKKVGATDMERLFQLVDDLNEEHLAITEADNAKD